MTTEDSTEGQIVLPAAECLEPAQNQGLLDWLLACPDKGFFVPVESESTDTL
jgi:hypothetical protein